jgi:hypothetical protein
MTKARKPEKEKMAKAKKEKERKAKAKRVKEKPPLQLEKERNRSESIDFMKAFALVCIAALLFGLVAAVKDLAIVQKDLAIRPDAEISCDVCVQFMDQAVNQLLQIILQIGIGGGCAEICGALPNQYEAIVCDLICEYVGVEEFSNLIQDADPDPIWICMAIDLCPAPMNAAAKITAMTITPTVGKINQPMEFTVTFNVINQTGMTDLALLILSPKNDGFPIESDWESYSQAPGSYGTKVKFTPQPNQYDPFPAGVYTAIWFVCEGPCGCTHSLCYTMDKQQTTFKLTH